MNYLYNGVEFPDVYTSWTGEIQQKYPYLHIEQHAKTGRVMAYAFSAKSVHHLNYNGRGYLSFGSTKYWYAVANTTNWTSGREHQGAVGAYTTPSDDDENYCKVIWANYDVYNDDGTLYLAASDPVPVSVPTPDPLSLVMGCWVGCAIRANRGKPHVHAHTAVVTDPTCTEKGFTTYSCACGDTYTADEVEALGHEYVDEVIEPTTESEGYTLHTCSRCGDSYKDNYTDKLPQGDPIAYSYNGVQLPDINTVYTDERKAQYPCAAIHYESYYSGYVLTICATSIVIESGNVICKGNYITFLANQSGWAKKAQSSTGINLGSTALWANIDIAREDGSVYLSASDPIPVYA